jgi:hypothetical protein
MQEDVSVRGGVRKIDDDSVVDLDPAIATGGFQEACGREIEVAADLILDLEEIREVLPGKDRAVGS